MSTRQLTFLCAFLATLIFPGGVLILLLVAIGVAAQVLPWLATCAVIGLSIAMLQRRHA